MRRPCTMGCGRSKSHTIGLDDTSDQESTSTSQKSSKKLTKSANKLRDKENRDQSSRTSSANTKQNGVKVSEIKSTSSGNRQEVSTNSSSNGSIVKETSSGTDAPESKAPVRELQPVKTAFKDRQQLSTGALQSSNTKITGSQIEFFKMLDEKIEKGTEYAHDVGS